MAELTKKALSEALTDLLRTRRLDKITVAELTALAGVNRQTFYYHFSDIFALMKWTAYDRYHKLLSSHGIGPGMFRHEVYTLICDGMVANRTVVLNVYKGMDDAHIRRALRAIVDPEIEKEAVRIAAGRLDEDDLSFVVSCYASGLVGVMVAWLESGMEERYRGKLDVIFTTMEKSIALLVSNLVAD